jgi:predicted TIM-barrel fold metal-dependent hydrolase
MPTIDADCHVIESDHTWDFLDDADQRFRPQPFESDANPGVPYWVIDGKVRPRPFGTVTRGNRSEELSGFSRTSLATRSMEDLSTRLKHMDELGIDTQVLYPTVYLTQISQNPETELALAKSYNRWLAEVWKEGGGRLRWAAVPPLLSMDAVPEQLRFAKEHGACGVFMRGFEGDYLISDPYFYPLYEEASALDLPICVHAGCGNPAFTELTKNEAFPRNKFPVLSAFHSFLYQGTPELFPKLRFGFIEVAAQWIPYMLVDLKRRIERDGGSFSSKPMADGRMFVACQTNDDLGYILSYGVEDNLVIGSDYGHSDTSSELEALRELRTNGNIDPSIIDRILGDNPRRLYGI